MSFETGFFVGTDPSVLTGLSNWLGKSIDVMNWQLDRSSWTAWLNSLSYSQGKLAGVTTQINYTVPLITTGSSLSTAAAHGYDSYYVQAAKALLAISGNSQSQIVVRVGEEFNGTWMPWAASGHEADFAQAYRNFVDAFRSVSNKFVFEWNVAVGSSGADMNAAYPGDKYVDVISGDLYWDSTQSWSVKDPTQAFNYYASTTNGLNWLANFAAAHGKATALSEWGVNSDNAAPFIQSVYNWLTANHAVYESYWNSTSTFNGMLSNGQYPDAAAEFLALFGGSGTMAGATSSAATAIASSAATVAAASTTMAAHAVSDFTGDGHSDILWSNANGLISTWNATTNGSYLAASGYLAPVAVPWHAVEAFDFNGDGKADILMQSTDGRIAIWESTGSSFAQSAYMSGAVSSDWRIAGTGDFNGDGKADILWVTSAGAVGTWLSNGSSFQTSGYYHAPVGSGWQIEGVGDFNGDGKSDILWRNASGAISTWLSTGTSFNDNGYYHADVDRSWHIVGIGDFNGDGKDDLLWRNDNGAVSEWTANSSGGFDEGQFNGSAGTSWSVADVGDFNGDGKADILWRNANGAVSVWESTGSGFNQNAHYDPSVGSDWNVVSHSFVM